MVSKGLTTRSQLQPKETYETKKSNHTKVKKKECDYRNKDKVLRKCVEKLISKTEKRCSQAKTTTPDKRKYRQKSLIDFAKIPECKTPPPESTTLERTVDKGRRTSPRNKLSKSNISSTSLEEGINAAGPSFQHCGTNAESKTVLKATVSDKTVNNGKRRSPRNISPNSNISSTVTLSKSQSVLTENKKRINESKLKTSNTSKRKAVQQTSNRRNKKKSDSPCGNKLNTLNKWLSKTNSDSTKESGSSRTKNKKSKNNRKLIRRQSSGTFEKYGMRIPTFEDIVSYQEKVENQKKILEGLNMEDSQESLELNIEEPVPDNLLDCKNLSPRDIQKALTENIQYICDIADGKLYSERHEAFIKPKQAQGITNLNYNTSMSVFTIEQKQLLLSELHKLFENNENNYCSNNRYYFQVLLPELCLKIFMDAHNMDHDTAAAYLEDRPVDETL